MNRLWALQQYHPLVFDVRWRYPVLAVCGVRLGRSPLKTENFEVGHTQDIQEDMSISQLDCGVTGGKCCEAFRYEVF